MRIRWTRSATRDLTQICNYIAERDGAAVALRIALSVCNRIDTLTRFPERGRPGRKQGTREFVLTGLPYLAVYSVNESVTEILRVLHGAQDWPQ